MMKRVGEGVDDVEGGDELTPILSSTNFPNPLTN